MQTERLDATTRKAVLNETNGTTRHKSQKSLVSQNVRIASRHFDCGTEPVHVSTFAKQTVFVFSSFCGSSFSHTDRIGSEDAVGMDSPFSLQTLCKPTSSCCLVGEHNGF